MERLSDEFDLIGCLETLAASHPERCTVAPSPELNTRIHQEVARLRRHQTRARAHHTREHPAGEVAWPQ